MPRDIFSQNLIGVGMFTDEEMDQIAAEARAGYVPVEHPSYGPRSDNAERRMVEEAIVVVRAARVVLDQARQMEVAARIQLAEKIAHYRARAVSADLLAGLAGLDAATHIYDKIRGLDGVRAEQQRLFDQGNDAGLRARLAVDAEFDRQLKRERRRKNA